MSSDEFGWEELLHTDAPPTSTLKAGLFTTYDRPDDRLLAEHLLPMLLRLEREPDGEGHERQYFLLELDRRLKQLHDRLVVVSSTISEEECDTEEGESATYGWIWGSIRHLTVGRREKAVQHAKLWLLHWGAAVDGGNEYMEIVVSSANLTRSAFRGQIQAVWRALIELHPQRAEARLRSWGLLPGFLRELADSTGDEASFAPFIELLARADCPEGVSFLASVPGRHKRKTLEKLPWGSAGLARMAPAGRGHVHMSVLSPFVGSWSADELEGWCDAFSGATDRLELVWIEKGHPWAASRRWVLPRATCQVLSKAGASLLRLRHDPDDHDETDLFHDEHHLRDNRWSHAKIYALQRGNSRRVLLTSANFSLAAWGSANRDGDLTIENFELGVWVDRAVWPFANLGGFDNAGDVATVSLTPSRPSAHILWARAAWDGKHVEVQCRCQGSRPVTGHIFANGEPTRISTWMATEATDASVRSARVPWMKPARDLPSSVQLTCDGQTVSVTVFDERPSQDRDDILPPGVDADIAQALRDNMLFEQYGGLVADDMVGASIDADRTGSDLAGAANSEDEIEDSDTGPRENHGVPAFMLARRHLEVVDSWTSHVVRAAKPEAADFERRVLEDDGDLLVDAFRRQALRDEKVGPSQAIGANLAVEELTIRLKHLREA